MKFLSITLALSAASIVYSMPLLSSASGAIMKRNPFSACGFYIAFCGLETDAKTKDNHKVDDSPANPLIKPGH
ncbi:hypothetical protein CLAFUW4_10884 [Fulvia fulva]|uniref:Uncharacterized protein n=1 Tax=Passalora fulva TaxID=5499 RepID=A0A9Q8PDL7_PASFU|nr:uncharacterized protein CLAFUR5_09926 [Fulvia fulva]KAK4619302.1 hypothetical protein CLAFUR4_10889 [Fulvia fulva]KAK4621032.1 hypothetical protein CLAFUR0_10896 [Fulvia fulva]UJO20467.1 hypothetical protein CLAFUR5_09926 [Fulvia fulva]WPV16860.1 hypothetical protein CLAFUW4_10884 [Fulvia fulva]WPV32026.1 hypothetical protein CLAFUW7_10882 [Fulvia fulva]